MNANEKANFRLYLHYCTNAQVQGVYDKEKLAGRNDYAELALDEARERKIKLSEVCRA